MTTPAEWDGHMLRAVDLDLDVVRGFNGTVIVDDEDEFAEHQVAYGYPEDVITGGAGELRGGAGGRPRRPRAVRREHAALARGAGRLIR